jgi:hypothetical protein
MADKTIKVIAQDGTCPDCGRQAVLLYDTVHGIVGCDRCLSQARDGVAGGLPAPLPYAPELPAGQERLARSIEELSRELRITRELVISIAQPFMALRGEGDGQDSET